MDIQTILAELRAAYPGANLVRNAPDGRNVTEIVCELPATDPRQSRAIAVIERSPRHHHVAMTEIYRVIKGSLNLYVGEAFAVLHAGDEFTITPPEVHWATSDPKNPAWVEVICNPAFSAHEFILD